MEKSKKEILDNPDLKKNPWSPPEEYFSTLEERVHLAIKEEEESTPSLISRLKPSLMLFLMFGIIVGVGYLSLKLTDALQKPSAIAEKDGIMALIENGYLKSSFIEEYYDEIDLGNLYSDAMQEITFERIMDENLSEDEILDYIDY